VPGPPVALVHGFAGSAATTWGGNGWFDLLADEGRDTIGIDLLGHGTAPAPHEPEAYSDLAGFLAEQLPDGPVDAIAFSLGAQTVLGLAAREPGRFRRIVVAGIGDDVFDPPDAEPVAALIEAGGELPDHPFVHHLVELARESGNDLAALVACLRRPRTPLTEAALATVELPVLVALGDRDEAGPADRLVGALPDARLVVLRRTDHARTPRSMDFLDAALGFVVP